MHNDEGFLVDFEPIGKRIPIHAGQTILEAAQKGGIALLSVCGGIGLCQDCVVRIVQGEVSPITQDEKTAFTPDMIAAGYRLACQTRVLGNIKLDIPPESLSGPQRLQLESLERILEIDPVVLPVDFILPLPLPSTAIDRHTLFISTLQGDTPTGLTCSDSVQKVIDPFLMENAGKGRALIRDKKIIELLPYKADCFGIAADIGTTKIAFFLVDLETGEIKFQAGMMNPQIAFGEDVISRISYANESPRHAADMHKMLISALNSSIMECIAETGSDVSQIVDAVIVGNTAMHHFFTGLPVRQLGEAPYVPAVYQSMQISSLDIGLLMLKDAEVYLPPNIAGYVGGDHVAMLVDTKIASADDTVVALDIGTNTEISLVNDGKLYSCSCASGPAFEGARIEMGMRAAPGAIEKVELIQGKLEYSTIANLSPVGICGSGILDAVAVMQSDGVIDHRGALQKGHKNLYQINNTYRYILASKEKTGTDRDIYITRKDVNEIQLAKAAIRAGIESLLAQAGITGADIDRVIIAGAFGTYINLKSAIQIGMLPELPLEKFTQVGNAAGAGARQMLLSRRIRREAENIALSSNYLELTAYKNFLEFYASAMSFK